MVSTITTAFAAILGLSAVLIGLIGLRLPSDFKRSLPNGDDLAYFQDCSGGEPSLIKIVTRAASVDGAYFEFIETATRLSPGTITGKPGSPPVHNHRSQLETFTVLKGIFMYTANGTEGYLTEGQTLVVPPGTAHTWWVGESADNETAVLIKVEPAGLLGEAAFETLAGLSRDYGCVAKVPVPQMVLWAEAQNTELSSLPAPAKLFARLVMQHVSRVLGYRPVYPEYTSSKR